MYITIRSGAKDSFTEKKSEFIGQIFPCETKEQALAYVEKVRSENRKARHNVYAYICRRDNACGYSDDGEPQGTGGMPVLEVLKKNNLTDVCVVVTRYFGGILLGASGLTRAYSKGCAIAVEAAVKKHMYDCTRLEFSAEYTLYGSLTRIFPEYEVIIEKEDFADTVNFSLLVKNKLCEKLTDNLTELSAGKIICKKTTNLEADFS